MRLFSYKIVRDFGFAPNPFHGTCTLATCKPQIRAAANVGDLILGCGSVSNNLAGRMIFVMRVSLKCTFQEYWDNPRFLSKRVSLYGSRARSFGDNIYHKVENHWVQEDSHHSLEGGALNIANLNRDLSADSVLIGTEFIYWGGSAPMIPAIFRSLDDDDIYPNGRNYRTKFSHNFVSTFDEWFNAQEKPAVIGRPGAW